MQDKGLSDRYINGVNAFYLAESGIDQALVFLRANPNAPSIPYTSSNVIQGGYQVTIENAGTTLRRITAVGYVPLNDPASFAYAERRLQSYASNSEFRYALFGVEEIGLSGNAVVDSYDSSLGAYDVTTATSNADIGTNSIDDGSIKLSGNVLVKGDAVAGPEGDPSKVIYISGGASLTGSLESASSLLLLAAPAVPPGTPNNGSLKITDNNVVTLPGGTYWYASINMSANSQLIFTGDTKVYVSGDTELSSALITTHTAVGDNLPVKLTLYLVAGGNIKMTGTSRFYGQIYAPRTEVRITGASEIFGAIAAKEIDIEGTGNGAKIHYDESLLGLGNGTSNNWRLISWREVFNP